MDEIIQIVKLLFTHYYGVVLLVAVLAIVIYGFHPIERWRFRHIPGPPIRWLVGCLPEIAAHGLTDAYDTWASQYATYGVFKVFWGGYSNVVITDPELMRRVFTSSSQKYNVPLLLPNRGEQDMYNNNMLFANGLVWKEMRNVWTPFLTKTKLESYFPAMLRSIERLEEHLDVAAEEQQAFDLWPVIGSLTFDVIATAAAGLNIETLKSAKLVSGEDQQHVGLTPQSPSKERKASLGATDEGLAHTLTTAMRQNLKSVDMGPLLALVYLLPGLIWIPRFIARHMPTKRLKRGLEARNTLTTTYDKLVSAVRLQQQGLPAPCDVSVAPESFLATVSAVKDKSTGELKPAIWPIVQSHLFLIAGFETTANAITYCLYLLSAHPEKEARVLEEVDKFGRDRVPTSVSDLEELPYLRAVLEEALRLMPPAPFAIREARTDMQLGPYAIKKGTRLHTFMYGMHHSAKHWDKPLEFVPERFLAGTEESKVVKPGALMPFGEGARRCPGYKLAIQESVLSLLCLYQRYTFRLLPGQKPLKVRGFVTLCPTNGVHVTVHKRN